MDSDVGTALVRGIWAAMAIAVIIVVLRVYAKIKIHQFRADDVLMMIAMVCFLPLNTKPRMIYRMLTTIHRSWPSSLPSS
jgi:hypothetical protein